jgi:uncharacterized membrane protein
MYFDVLLYVLGAMGVAGVAALMGLGLWYVVRVILRN